MNQLFIHLGLHKTGTTFLQENIFPSINTLKVIRGWKSFRFLMDTSLDQKIMISDEEQSGIFYHGDWMKQFEKNVDLINTIFKDPAILIGFRRHSDLLLSMYKQYLLQGGTESIEYLYEPFSDNGVIKNHEMFFTKRVQYLQKYFSKIFVYTLDEIQNDLDNFIQELALFLDVITPSKKDIITSKRHVGIKGIRQNEILMNLNRTNNWLKNQKSMPTLNNKIFKKLRITPNDLCKNILSFLPSQSLVLPNDIKAFLDKEYYEDWNFILEQCKNRSSIFEN